MPIKKTTTKKADLTARFRVNDEIRFHGNVRIVGEGIESRVVSMAEAKGIAEEMEMDLVELQTKGDIPVIRLCQFDKFIYEMKKAMKKNKQNTHQLKEVQLKVNIAKHDLETKANNARRFLNEGHKVKVVLTMKGRELSRRDENKRAILEFIVMMEDIAVPESTPRDEGNKTIVILKKKSGS